MPSKFGSERINSAKGGFRPISPLVHGDKNIHKLKEKSDHSKFIAPLDVNKENQSSNTCVTFDKRTWQDGSVYEGQLVNDMRHGQGIHKWMNGETYEGTFFKDHRHGYGIYTWPDGTKFAGTFYLDQKEGYGVFNFPNGDVFEGLYKNDERFGPGVFTYVSNGKTTQDIGIWHREKLLRICTKVEDVFSVKSYFDLEYFPEEHHEHIKLNRQSAFVDSIFSKDRSSFTFFSKNFADALFSEHLALPSGIETYCEDFQNLPKTLQLKEEFDKAYFGSSFKMLRKDSQSSLEATNNTKLNMDIQLHTYRHQDGEKVVSFKVDSVVKGNRESFESVSGPHEIASLKLIENAESGDTHAVYSVLKSGLVDPNVSDNQGNCALVEAGLKCHHDVVNTLLDYGANVNQLTDEGVSALTACHVFYYPADHFKFNIAEGYVDNYRRAKPKEKDVVKRNRLTISMYKISQITRSSSPDLPPKGRLLSDEPPNIRRKTVASASPAKYDDAAGRLFAPADPIETCKSDLKIKELYKRSMSAKSRGQSVDADGLNLAENERLSEQAETESLPDDLTFTSDRNMFEYGINITEDLIEKTATLLSLNERAVSGIATRGGEAIRLGTPAALAVWKAEQTRLRSMIYLLLQRGANPNIGSVPFPPLFFAVKAGDTEAVRLLLQYGASPNARVSCKLGGLTPLHIAAGITCPEAVDIVELLLHANANPNAAAYDDHITYDVGKTGLITESSETNLNYYKWRDSSTQWVKEDLKFVRESGRTPLHIACDRDDNYEDAEKIVRLLLENGADPDVIWSGHSPLSLAIMSGNDLCVDALLEHGANASLPLPRGNGNALCVASNPEYEHRRSCEGRLDLISKLVGFGANILAPVAYSSKLHVGTVVDYAHWTFARDTRIAHTPYHALTPKERETYNARRQLLAHLGALVRQAAISIERERLNKERQTGVHSNFVELKLCCLVFRIAIEEAIDEAASERSSKSSADEEFNKGRSPSRDGRFLYIGAGADYDKPDVKQSPFNLTDDRPSSLSFDPNASRVSFQRSSGLKLEDGKAVTNRKRSSRSTKRASTQDKRSTRKPLFRYCYECGRSVGVRLTPCSRCHEVYFCSRACKLKSWDDRHKDECLRVRVPVEASPLPTTPEIQALFADHPLEETMGRARERTTSVVDSILGGHLQIADQNVRTLTSHTSFIPRTSTGRWTATSRSRVSRISTRPGTKEKKSESAKGHRTKQATVREKAGRSSAPPMAMVGPKTRARVGKDVEFGTTGMTLAELGITENYSYE